MSTSTRKRKHPPKRTPQAQNIPLTEQTPALYIQAHEADIIRGPRARDAARSLEIRGQGSALIPWGRSRDSAPEKSKPVGMELIDQDASFDGTGSDNHFNDGKDEEIWVDRYDARLLLDSLPPNFTQTQIQLPPSPSGWSDLPSDTEDTFFFSPSEADDYHREKRRRTIDKDHESRLQALRDTGQDGPNEDFGGGSDEEPDDAQKTLMHRTATHILQSPNPALLEMRILANHGADTRFAFLRGRWKNAWEGLKAELLAQKEKEKLGGNGGGGGLGGLAGYGESDDDEDSGIVDKDVEHKPLERADDEDVKVARRARAKEWAEKRRELISNKT